MHNLENEIKELIIEGLGLEDLTKEDIDSTEPLFGAGLGLDSIDALELGISLKKKYNLQIQVQNDSVKKHFYSVRTLAKFIKSQQQGVPE